MVALYNATDRVKISEKTDSYTTEAQYAHTFAELVAFIEDTLTDREHTPSIKLSYLVQLYEWRLVRLGVSSPCVHSTRLMERILVSFPELQAFKDGQDVLKTLNEYIGIVLVLRQVGENDVNNDACILAQAV